MEKTILALVLIAGISSLEINTITGPTPPAPECPPCNGRADGNYAIEDYPHDFLQCSNGTAHCQSCWPHTLYFKESCDQCMYNITDPCYTTASWQPHSTYPCPDMCPSRGPEFSGNMADPGNYKHYIGCWKGVTQGCVICPADLQFNEDWNACLHDGQFLTEPRN